MSEPYGLQRFVDAQAEHYAQVLEEIRQGCKRSHWMWFVFPQVDGLGVSEMARYYAIKSRAEAEAYLRHPVLGARLIECANAVLSVQGRTAFEIFGRPDDLKLRSCATLFASVSEPQSVFQRLLDRYFQGRPDHATLQRLRTLSPEP